MNMRTTFIYSALAIGWGVCASAQDSDFQSPMLGFFEAGVLCALDGGQVREAPNTVAGTTHVVEETPEFISNARVVPAVLGVGFGVRAGLLGDQGVEGVTMTVTHPPFAGNGATEQSFVTQIGVEDAPGITFYQFDYGYELALGDWTMTASVGSTILYEADFTVVPPSALPELAGICGYQDLIG